MSISTISTGCGIYFHHAVVHLAISYRYSITRRIWLAHPYLEKTNPELGAVIDFQCGVWGRRVETTN